MLIDVSSNFPNKLEITGKRFEKIDQVFSYKNEVLKTIDQIDSIRTFFYLTDLTDDFTDHWSVDQFVRYGSIIDVIKEGSKLEEHEIDNDDNV